MTVGVRFGGQDEDEDRVVWDSVPISNVIPGSGESEAHERSNTISITVMGAQFRGGGGVVFVHCQHYAGPATTKRFYPIDAYTTRAPVHTLTDDGGAVRVAGGALKSHA